MAAVLVTGQALVEMEGTGRQPFEERCSEVPIIEEIYLSCMG